MSLSDANNPSNAELVAKLRVLQQHAAAAEESVLALETAHTNLKRTHSETLSELAALKQELVELRKTVKAQRMMLSTVWSPWRRM